MDSRKSAPRSSMSAAERQWPADMQAALAVHAEGDRGTTRGTDARVAMRGTDARVATRGTDVQAATRGTGAEAVTRGADVQVGTRELGAGGPRVMPIGLGCMGMSWIYAESGRDDAESVRVIREALDSGVGMLDTALVYGDGHNERLVGRAVAGRLDDVVVATKGGLVVDDLATKSIHRDGRPGVLRRHVEGSLERLGVERIDLYYLHRVDPHVPLEESWGALAELVAEGKLARIGLSEVTVAQAAAAHAIHPVAAIQSELSVWTRDPLGGEAPGDTGARMGADASGAGTSGAAGGKATAPKVADGNGADGKATDRKTITGKATAGNGAAEAEKSTAAGARAEAGGNLLAWTLANGVAFVPFAPLGRGYLTGTLAPGTFESGDIRSVNPRFTAEAFERNRAIGEEIASIAAVHGATSAQVSLAWLLGLADNVIPIPGTRSGKHLAENLEAVSLRLSDAERERLDRLPPAYGSRY